MTRIERMGVMGIIGLFALGNLEPSRAQETSPTAEDIRALRKRIEELEEKVKVLERTREVDGAMNDLAQGHSDDGIIFQIRPGGGAIGRRRRGHLRRTTLGIGAIGGFPRRRQGAKEVGGGVTGRAALGQLHLGWIKHFRRRQITAGNSKP